MVQKFTKHLKKMNNDLKLFLKHLRQNLFVIIFLCLVGTLTARGLMDIILPDDPPKPKKEVKQKDTIQIDLQQMQEINETTNKRSLFLDTLIMRIDTLKKKK